MKESFLRIVEKSLLWMPLVILLISMVGVNPVVSSPSPTPTVAVEPSSIEEPDLMAFSINITFTNVTDLISWGLYLSWDPSLLNVTTITQGPFATDVWVPPKINETKGEAILGGGVYAAVNGSGFVATFNFTAEATGTSVLDLYSTVLGCLVDGSLTSVAHDVVDGWFDMHAFMLKHEVVVNGKTYYVATKSNSSISNFVFNETYVANGWVGEISFNVTGPAGTIGFCNVTIPKNLTTGTPWLILVDGTSRTYTQSENTTYTSLYFTYTHGDTPSLVQICGAWVVPEFSAPMLLMTLIIVALAIALLAKRTSPNERRSL